MVLLIIEIHHGFFAQCYHNTLFYVPQLLLPLLSGGRISSCTPVSHLVTLTLLWSGSWSSNCMVFIACTKPTEPIHIQEQPDE